MVKIDTEAMSALSTIPDTDDEKFSIPGGNVHGTVIDLDNEKQPETKAFESHIQRPKPSNHTSRASPPPQTNLTMKSSTQNSKLKPASSALLTQNFHHPSTKPTPELTSPSSSFSS